jgi:PAS domain S-box-containing protein
MSVLASGLSFQWLARPLILAIAVLLLLIAGTGFLGFQYWHERRAADYLLEHSRQSLDTLDRLRTIIADLEAERRGYLMTLDPSYLKAYGVSDESVRRDTQSLQALVAEDPLQSLRAGHLALTISATLSEIDDMVKTTRSSGGAALAMIRSMDEIRSQIDQMVDHERFLLANRESQADALEQRKSRLILVAVAIVIILAGVALALARVEERRRRKATEENVQLHGDLQESERRIRRLVDANIIGIIIWDLEGRIFDANDAFLKMVGYDRADLASGLLHRMSLTPPEWHASDARTVSELKLTGTAQPFEKEYLRKDGTRLPVLIGGAMFEESRNHGVAFVLDLTERKRAEAEARESDRKYREAIVELAHANRIATMGQLTASIAHEVNQPIAAALMNAQAGLRFLGAQNPELDTVRQVLGRIVGDCKRAGEIVSGIRALTKKAPSHPESLEINKVIFDVIALARSDALKSGVTMRTQLAEHLPVIQADRVQLQQVLLNLIINAIEAMRSLNEGARDLLISASRDVSDGVLVAVRDTGPGLDPRNVDLLFDPFYTTKLDGMGMGLAICRSIIDAHGGRLWVDANGTRGAVFQFTLPSGWRECIYNKKRSGEMRAG